jgi:hypothetical protein
VVGLIHAAMMLRGAIRELARRTVGMIRTAR